LNAIQNLQNTYPFATGLLIYCLIERMLKSFIRNEVKKDHPKLDKDFCDKLKHKKDNAVRKQLIRLNIARIAHKFTDANDKKILKEISGRRDKYMHSDDLLEPVVEKDQEKRSEIHKKYLQQAVKDLKDTFDILEEDYEVIIGHDGNICDF